MLVEQDVAPRELPTFVASAPAIAPSADKPSLFALTAVAIDEKVGVDGELVRILGKFDLDVRDESTNTRWWIIGPSQTRLEATDPIFEIAVVVVVHRGALIRLRRRSLVVSVAILTDRQPVVDVIGQKRQPVGETLFVKKARFAV